MAERIFNWFDLILNYFTEHLSQDQVEKSISFITGDLAVMAFLWIHLDISDFLVKICATIILGIVGGAAGLCGKDLYNWVKTKAKKKWH